MNTDECQRKLKNRVRERRKLLKMTQAHLAERAGITRQTVIQIEGVPGHMPIVPIALRLADVLGVDVAWLFYEELAEEAVAS